MDMGIYALNYKIYKIFLQVKHGIYFYTNICEKHGLYVWL